MGRRAWAWVLPVLCGFGCGGEAEWPGRVDPVSGSPPVAEQFPQGPGPEEPPTPEEPTPPPPDPDPEPDPEPQPVVRAFQPGFFQNLRASRKTHGRVTLRYRIPVTRSGERIQIVVAAGNSSLVIHQATVGRDGGNGSLDGKARQLRFADQPQVTVPSLQRVASDPLSFEVDAPEDLVISLDVDGGVRASLIDAFPGSFIAPEGQAWHTHLVGAAPQERLWGLTAVLVEADEAPVFLAVGDSITEGYVSGDDDVRHAWPHLAAVQAQVPVVNGAVSGQGVYQANELREAELHWVPGITHCLVMLGTNDLAAIEGPELIRRLGLLFDGLHEKCEVWAGTLVPRERADGFDLSVVHARRAQVNAWLRARPPHVARVVDFEAATARPGDVNRFRDGYGYDGIHPSRAGQTAMGDAAADAVRETLKMR